jgi:hypothetical protein
MAAKRVQRPTMKAPTIAPRLRAPARVEGSNVAGKGEQTQQQTLI